MIATRFYGLAMAMAFGALGCPPVPSPPGPPDADAATPTASDGGLEDGLPPAPRPDASPPVPAPMRDAAPLDACAQAESTLLTLACKDSRGRPLGGPTKSGVPFAQVCRDSFAHGVDVHAGCLAKATSCLEVSQCSL